MALKFGDGVTTYENLKEISGSTNGSIIELVKLAGTALPIGKDKSIDIPMATAQTLGLVMGTDLENGISVAENGVMSINSVNVNKLTQAEEELLILDGGNSNI